MKKSSLKGLKYGGLATLLAITPLSCGKDRIAETIEKIEHSPTEIIVFKSNGSIWDAYMKEKMLHNQDSFHAYWNRVKELNKKDIFLPYEIIIVPNIDGAYQNPELNEEKGESVPFNVVYVLLLSFLNSLFLY